MQPQQYERQGIDNRHRSFLYAAKSLFDIGMNSSNLQQAECCLFRACKIFEECLSTTPNVLSEKEKHLFADYSTLLVHARLRLGQVAAVQGKLEEAFVFLRSIVLNDNNTSTLRAIAFYDIGVIWMRCDRPEQALEAFQQAVSIASLRHLQTSNISSSAFFSPELFIRFIPNAMKQLEILLDSLEEKNKRPGAMTCTESKLPWSIGFFLPALQDRTTSPSSDIHASKGTVWAAAGAA